MKCRRILVVEDDEAIRDILQFALEEHGYTVSFAANGQDGISVLKQMGQPCLILLDLMMPVMDGWEFAHAMEKDRRLKNNPIVLVTASCEKIESIPYKEVLKKPLDIHRLFDTVGRYVEAEMA